MLQHIFAPYFKTHTMKQMIYTAAASLFMLSANYAQVNWKVDASHSKVSFSVVHALVAETEGRFKVYDGQVSSKSETDFSNANISFSVDAASINTEDEKRDGHLKSPDFFDVAQFPQITFKSTSMKSMGKNTYELEGELTMHGVTKKVKLKAVGAPKTVKDPWGNTKYGFKVTGTINRKDFGLMWNKTLEAGGVLVAEDVDLVINIELSKA